MNAEEFKNTIIPLVRKFYPMIKRFLKDEEDAKDALQDMMLKLWDKRKEIESALNRDSYVAVMAKNHCLDSLKKKRTLPMKENEKNIVTLTTEESGFETRERLEKVNQAIGNLPGRYREIIQMRDIDGFSYSEINAMTGLEIPHIRVILSRSRMKVREELVKIYDYEKRTDKRFTEKIL